MNMIPDISLDDVGKIEEYSNTKIVMVIKAPDGSMCRVREDRRNNYTKQSKFIKLFMDSYKERITND